MSIDTIPADIELAPDSIEYIAIGKVRVTMKTETGDTVTYTMKSASLVEQINQSVALINSCSAQIFRDMGLL